MRLLAAEYRLCPKGKNVTEECFQQMPLQPATDKQYIVYGAIKIEPPVSATLFSAMLGVQHFCVEH